MKTPLIYRVMALKPKQVIVLVLTSPILISIYVVYQFSALCTAGFLKLLDHITDGIAILRGEED